jgi:hypothetical protein
VVYDEVDRDQTGKNYVSTPTSQCIRPGKRDENKSGGKVNRTVADVGTRRSLPFSRHQSRGLKDKIRQQVGQIKGEKRQRKPVHIYVQFSTIARNRAILKTALDDLAHAFNGLNDLPEMAAPQSS